MNSKLYTGTVEHERFHPRHHRLHYGLYVYALDLNDLELLDRRLPLFGYNRPKPVALHDGDYLDDAPGSIQNKLLQRIAPEIRVEDINRVIMVTSPRLLGYTFNPVSFYFCYDKQEQLAGAVAEVNNTFGEKHVYVLNHPNGGTSDFPARFQAEKVFHVSPFNSMEGTYEFTFSDVRRELDLSIDLHRDGEHIMNARLKGDPNPLTPFYHLKTVLRHSFVPHLTMSRIWREALKLRMRRKLTFFSKPVPISDNTIRRNPPTVIQRHCMALMFKMLAQTRHSHLEITLPDSTVHHFGNQQSETKAKLRVNDHRFFSRTIMGSDIGLGEAFMYDEWDTDDIAAVIRFFIRNRNTFNDGNLVQSLLSRLLEKGRYLMRANTLIGSRRNIHAHYDLSNAFFQTFLDDSMAYSSAIFSDPDQSLEAAQRNKFHTIIEKARLTREDHLLEIGCGWGGFAIEAARRSGCRVTGITISKAQFDLATQRVREAGLADRIAIRFCDYRAIDGQYDKIVSIEMLEAVGHAYYKTFFQKMDRLLKPDGIAVLQTISITDQRYDSYRKSHDWIQKHIFPGGLLPSLTRLVETMTRHTQLSVDHMENIGNHYAVTLNHWHRRFDQHLDRVASMGFDRVFQRKWKYYMGSCEAAFRERVLGDIQLVITREGNRTLQDRLGRV